MIKTLTGRVAPHYPPGDHGQRGAAGLGDPQQVDLRKDIEPFYYARGVRVGQVKSQHIKFFGIIDEVMIKVMIKVMIRPSPVFILIGRSKG